MNKLFVENKRCGDGNETRRGNACESDVRIKKVKTNITTCHFNSPPKCLDNFG